MSRGIDRLIDIMARLRDPVAGCPWDREQDFRSIAPYTIEEAYEVADAIDREDLEALREELGDLLLQVVYHARMAEEDGDFDFAAVAAAISDKMVRRHPHVFGAEDVDSAAAQTRAWEDHKAAERQAKAAKRGGQPSVLDGVALGLPALTRAVKLQRRAARVGFDWPELLPVVDKIEEELAELKQEIHDGSPPERVADELGDLLFALANLARHLDADPEAALRHANAKFMRRFQAIEARYADAGRALTEASLDELEDAWRAVKQAERE
ncbi:MAG: nucleoside triphosphate pyrophosphohydrolase [Proteobacteria bacterium]|nr:nucleoside triphosphate pyrophosphohydrolase [Pseudomonadota bacterium]